MLGAVAAINCRGVRRGGEFVTVATLIKLLPLLVFVVAGVGAIHVANLTLAPTGSPAVGHAVLLSLFTFMGMEGALIVSGEGRPTQSDHTARPAAGHRCRHRAVRCDPAHCPGHTRGAPSPPQRRRWRMPWDASIRGLRLLLLVGAGLSMLGWLGADILASPRVLFAIARDGRLPALWGRLDPATHAPSAAILSYTAAGALLAITGTFAELAVLSALASTVLYAYICLAAWRLRASGTARAGAPLNFRWLKAAVIVGVASMIVLIALASAIEILGLAVLVGLSVALYLLQARSRPGARQSVAQATASASSARTSLSCAIAQICAGKLGEGQVALMMMRPTAPFNQHARVLRCRHPTLAHSP